MASNQDKSVVGLAALLMIVAFVVMSAATSIAVGIAFGGQWGFAALAAWAALSGIALARTIRKVGRERDDG